MRRLLYVPIIHEEADLGSAALSVVQESATLFGTSSWQLHREAVGKFWESVATYLRSLDPSRLKVYQDGLPADGVLGRRIVTEAARKGSKNYRLLLELLDSGAKLCKTEDAGLLWQERENILSMAGPGPTSGEVPHLAAEQYRRQRDDMMEARDKFIAQTIGATLKEEDLGVLFLGAYHNVVFRLPQDIHAQAVKDPELVRAYFAELLAGHDDRRLEELATRLAAPVLPI